MAFIRSKTKKGRKYYYVVESYRGTDGRTHQRTLEYIGPEKKLLEAAMRWREASVAVGRQMKDSGNATRTSQISEPMDS